MPAKCMFGWETIFSCGVDGMVLQGPSIQGSLGQISSIS